MSLRAAIALSGGLSSPKDVSKPEVEAGGEAISSLVQGIASLHSQ